MAKSTNRIKRPTRKKSKRISEAATTLTQQNIDDRIYLSFAQVCEDRCLLRDWERAELVSLVNTFKKMENCRWNTLYESTGLDPSWIPVTDVAFSLPPSVSRDARRLLRLKVTKKARLWGYRDRQQYRIIWFDRAHEVYPIGKVVRR